MTAAAYWDDMSIEGQKFYPGEVATPRQLLSLADEYLCAANHLRATGRRGQPASRAPFRLVAIHGIELYLNALLLASGLSAAKVRGMQHDLERRTELAVKAGLRLRKRTVADLKRLSADREYVTMRYEPELPGTVCQPNGLEATLNEVAEKVRAIVTRDDPHQ